MNAPDKIYVNFPYGEEHPWSGPMVTKQGLNRHDTIYIRKDALLEWAKKEMKEWSSESNTAQGVKMGLTLVLDKIESL